MPWRTATTRKTYTATPRPAASTAVVIGIDPGLARTGIGVIGVNGSTLSCLHHAVVRTDSAETLARRLAKISRNVSEVCGSQQPTVAAIERTFVNENPASSLSLGQARGAALAALALAGLDVNEIAPNTVKRSVTGDSLAGKKQVASMVRHILGLPPSLRLAMDASDALAVAISHASHKGNRLRLRRRPRRSRRHRR